MIWGTDPYPAWYPFPMADALMVMVLAVILIVLPIVVTVALLQGRRPAFRRDHTVEVHHHHTTETERVIVRASPVPSTAPLQAIGNQRPPWAVAPEDADARVTAFVSDLHRQPAQRAVTSGPKERIAGPSRKQLGGSK